MVACALFAWEPWPLTSFRLFSTVRSAEQQSWRATTLAVDGKEQTYPLGALPEGYRGFAFTMRDFGAADRARQDELCRTWVEAAPGLIDRDPVEVRIYLNTRLLSERDGDRSPPGTDELRYVCDGEGLSDAR